MKSRLRFATHTGSLLLVGACTSFAFGQGAVAYRGVTIETAGKEGRLENATLVLRDGKIEAVGVNVKPPEDARVIDGHGKTIMPGIIDPFKEIAIAGAGRLMHRCCPSEAAAAVAAASRFEAAVVAAALPGLPTTSIPTIRSTGSCCDPVLPT